MRRADLRLAVLAGALELQPSGLPPRQSRLRPACCCRPPAASARAALDLAGAGAWARGQLVYHDQPLRDGAARTSNAIAAAVSWLPTTGLAGLRAHRRLRARRRGRGAGRDRGDPGRERHALAASGRGPPGMRSVWSDSRPAQVPSRHRPFVTRIEANGSSGWKRWQYGTRPAGGGDGHDGDDLDGPGAARGNGHGSNGPQAAIGPARRRTRPLRHPAAAPGHRVDPVRRAGGAQRAGAGGARRRPELPGRIRRAGAKRRARPAAVRHGP